MEKLTSLLIDARKKENDTELLAYLNTLSSADLSDEISSLHSDQLKQLLSCLSSKKVAEILKLLDDNDRSKVVDIIENDQLLTIFKYMKDDDITDIIGDLKIGRQKDLLNEMNDEDRNVVTELLKYPEESAGGIMTTAYIALHDDRTVGEGLNKICEIAPKTEQIQQIYILNRKSQLVGSINLGKLLASPRDQLMKNIMDTKVISVQPTTDQEEAAKIVAKYDLNTLPVVKKGQLMGVITVDDIIDVVVQEADEDMLQLGGASKEETFDSPLSDTIKMRLPWLLINLVTAFLASSVVDLFQGTISKVVALSAIMTIVSGMGGNAATQTMSIVVRHLARDTISFKEMMADLWKEILAGIVDGAVNGLVTGIVVYFMYKNFYLSLIVLMAMIGNLIVAAVFGLMVPIILKKCHQDPAVASSIFVTTATDVLGFFIFLGLAQLFLPLLIK